MGIEKRIQIAIVKSDMAIISAVRFLRWALPAFIVLGILIYALNRADWR